MGEVAADVNRALRERGSVVVTAPPGAGKSTLLPLTVLESVPGKVLMLEPRRVAARQIAERMAWMLGEPVGRTVGYRMRFDHKVSADTRVEVLTEGVLVRRLVDDPGLDGVSVVIFDEFHERSITTDVALALTREARQVLRPDLKILLMSATIDTETLCREMDAPLVESNGKMFPVEVLRGKEEAKPENAAELVARTVREAHGKQEGDILAFLPGETDIRRCAELLGTARLRRRSFLCTVCSLLPNSAGRSLRARRGSGRSSSQRPSPKLPSPLRVCAWLWTAACAASRSSTRSAD